ncbi:M20 family metallopeptidase [Rhodococcus sp. NPDC057135]|uniref:M20 family metallopeptidase n=1 Tax=Rhodococcus sp. NPDC057135 TaxID=3346028 RepID=UPI003635A2E0
MKSTLLSQADSYVESGAFFEDLRRLVSYPTVSGSPEGERAIHDYLTDILTPALLDLGCSIERHDNWNGGRNSFLVGTRHEDPNLPTVLCYGHADVVNGLEDSWSSGRSPWEVVEEAGNYYGRGTADNKGQHWINLIALRLLITAQGRLGFNLKFLFECGEEIGSPDLLEFVRTNVESLSADLLIVSDGPRIDADTPTVILGARGLLDITASVDLRPSSYHSGNWGGLLRNPATVLAAAISSMVDGDGRLLLPELLPTGGIPSEVREMLNQVTIRQGPNDPAIDISWGDQTLTPAEKLYGWNTLEVLALGAADIDRPINAIPGTAKAALQLRFVVGTELANIVPAIRRHLDQNGFSQVQIQTGLSFPAARTDVASPWVSWVRDSIQRTTGTTPVVLPSLGGSGPAYIFDSILKLPAFLVPHSYPGCLQHAPDEHMPVSIARQGLQIATGLFYDLAHEVPDLLSDSTTGSARNSYLHHTGATNE